MTFRTLLAVVFGLLSLQLSAQDLSKEAGSKAASNYAFYDTRTETRPDGVTVRLGVNYLYTSTPVHVKVDLRQQPEAAQWKAGDPSWEVPLQRGIPAIVNPQPVNPVSVKTDALLQAQSSASFLKVASNFSTPEHNFNAIRSGASPNDANGEVGKNWFVAAINGTGGSQYMFYDKADPTITSGPFALSTLGGTGACAVGLGDPVVLYDEQAERWVFTEFSGSGNFMCIYVSQTDDPISGGFYVYKFEAPSFPDYPKYAVWGNAYYIGTNEDTSNLYALDRTAMLQGNAAVMVRRDISDPGAFGFAMIPPVDVDGSEGPAANSPGLFIRHWDDEAHTPNNNVPNEDYLELFEFDVNFNNPGNSTLTGPIRIAISEIDSHLCGFVSFNCFAQMGSGTTLDPLREVVMNLPKYRKFESHESIVGNFVTDVDGADHGGIRWFELRRSGGGNWTLFQEGTWAPDEKHRFMGASAMDKNGNIALGYSTTSSAIYPSVRYTGRESGSPLGSMSEVETELVAGTASSPNQRWGDYASMSVDPVDGCTFWLVENYAVSGGNRRQNRVGAFRFESCGEPTFEMSGSPLDQLVCVANDELSDVELNLTALAGFTQPVNLDLSSPPSGISGSFTLAVVNPDGISTAHFIVDTNTVVPGLNEIILRGTANKQDLSGTIVRELTLQASLQTAIPGPATLNTPSDQAVNQSTTPFLSWAAGSQALESTLEIASDEEFNDIVYSTTSSNNSHVVSSPLNDQTTYFWRVRSDNSCGQGTASEVFSFTTTRAPVEECISPGLAIPDNDPAGLSSDIVLNLQGQDILDLNLGLDITHSWVGDLEIRLEHVESATSVLVINRVCGSGDDIDVVLDDTASLDLGNCAEQSPVVSGDRQPSFPLANFIGLPTSGTWRLSLVDKVNLDSGVLNQWCLKHSSSPPEDPPLFKDGFEP